MKILHTSDLHIGRQFNGLSLEPDHDEILSQIVGAIRQHSVDVLIIAGDIFDRAAPPASAVRQFNSFLSQVARDTSAAVVMIAGNHDSGDRIASMSIMTDTRRALIRGSISADEAPLVLADAFGKVAFTGLPFAYEYAARECFGDDGLSNPEDVLNAQVTCARSNVPDDARWVLVAHAFVSGASTSQSERPLTRVGGIETVGPHVFEGAHYVALGHLHRPQQVGAPHIRYSGSPLAFGFDEVDTRAGEAPVKSMSLVDLDGAGKATIDTIAFKPLRRVRVLTGAHAELLKVKPSDDFIKIILTDRVPVIDAMKRLRDVFPNACELAYEAVERASANQMPGARSLAAANPIDVIGNFLEHVRGERLNEVELAIVNAGLRQLREKEDAK